MAHADQTDQARDHAEARQLRRRRFPEGKPSKYLPSPWEQMTSEQPLETAKAFARGRRATKLTDSPAQGTHEGERGLKSVTRF
jgi:hypothetical protein